MGRADREARSGSLTTAFFSLGALILLGAIGWGAWQLSEHIGELELRLIERRERNEQLGQAIAATRMEAHRQKRLAEQARELTEKARQAQEQSVSGAEVAAAERAEAEAALAEARREAEAAWQAAEEAEKQTEALLKRRREEWHLFADALSRISDATQSDWTIRATFPGELPRERLSRLAGVLLANHGYRVTIEDGGDTLRAQQMRDYLIDAGIPAEVLRLIETQQPPLRMIVRDTVFGDTAAAA